VAALGAIVATVGRSQLTTRLPHLTGAARTKLVDLLGSGASTSHLPGQVQGALNETYVYALTKGLYAIGTLALLGALLSWTLMGRRERGAFAPEPVAGAAPAGELREAPAAETVAA
jgi:hypothetical protein